MIYMFLSNNPSSGDINSSNLSCFVSCMFFCFVFFTANNVVPVSSGSSFEPCHKIAAIINVA